MSFPAYSSYRESGVDWVGAIPSDWRVQKFRYTFRESSERIEDEVVGPMLSVSGYRGVEIKEYDDENRRRTDEDLIGYRIVRPGQLVVNTMWLNYAGLGVSAYEGHVSPAYRSYWFVEKNADPRFVQYLMRSKTYVQGYTQLLTGIRPNSLQMSRADLMNFPILLPPRPTQVAVATFLDRETAKIDGLIEEQQRLIALLDEKRQVVISHAVTKGLHADVPMKDTGIEWLGEVPAHWEIAPVKRMTESLDFRRIPLSSEERGSRSGPYPYYGASGIIDCVDDFIFDEDLVLVSEDGANLLNRSTPIAFAATGKYWVNNHAHILKPLDGCIRYWAERIDAIDLAPVVTGSAQPKLTAEALANLRVAAPPTTEEKRAIEEAIGSAEQSLQPLIDEARRAVALLEERRTALIAEAVTGKIDVRGFIEDQAQAA